MDPYTDTDPDGSDPVDLSDPSDPGFEPEPSPPSWWQRNFSLVLAMVLVLMVGGIIGAIFAMRSMQDAADQKVVDASDLLLAKATANAVIKADKQMATLCPQGWNDGCATILAASVPPVPNPVCTVSTVVSGVAGYIMDDACRAAAIRVKMGEIEASQSQVTRPEQALLGTQAYQEEVFAQGDTSRIALLEVDPRLKREVILHHWHDAGVSWRILSHPSLTPADTAQIYGAIQDNGWLDAMPYLLINPNLSPDIRGMWVARPELDPVQREQTILLGLHQPSVATGMVTYLVDQAIEDGTVKADFTLWNVLLKAANNGDLPGPRCHLLTDKDEEHKSYPLCVKNVQWDFIQQMKEVQEANTAFPAPPQGWEVVRTSCQWETMAGRHSGVARGSASLVVPNMADVLPSSGP